MPDYGPGLAQDFTLGFKIGQILSIILIISDTKVGLTRPLMGDPTIPTMMLCPTIPESFHAGLKV